MVIILTPFESTIVTLEKDEDDEKRGTRCDI